MANSNFTAIFGRTSLQRGVRFLFVALLTYAITITAEQGSLLLLNNHGTWKEGDLILYNMENGETDTLFKGKAYGPCFSPDGKKVAFTISGKRPIQIINLATMIRDSILPAIDHTNLTWCTDSCIYWGRHRELYKVHYITGNVSSVYTVRMTYSPISADTQIAGLFTGNSSLNGKRGGYVMWSDQIGNRSIGFDYQEPSEVAINDGANTRTSCQASISADGQFVATANYNHTRIMIKPYNDNSVMAYSLYAPNVWVIKFSHDISDKYIFRNSGDSTTLLHSLTTDTSIKPVVLFKGVCAYGYDSRGWVKDFIATADSAVTLDRFTIAPKNSIIEPSQSVTFSYTSADQWRSPLSTTVAWAVSGGGTISQSGVFTSDGTIGEFTVTATPSIAPAVTATAKIFVERKNLAFGKRATYSSIIYYPGQWNSSGVVNGISQTPLGEVPEGGWSSACNQIADSTEWVEVDLSSNQLFNKIMIYPSNYMSASYAAITATNKAYFFPVDFVIQTITAAGDTDTIVSETNFTAPDYGVPVEYTFAQKNARYIRVTASMLGKSSEKNCYRCQFSEIKILNDSSAVIANESSIGIAPDNLSIIISPNPLQGANGITLQLTNSLANGLVSEKLTVSFYNLQGQLIETLYNGLVNRSRHSVNLAVNPRTKLSRGIYICRVQSKQIDKKVRFIIL